SAGRPGTPPLPATTAPARQSSSLNHGHTAPSTLPRRRQVRYANSAASATSAAPSSRSFERSAANSGGSTNPSRTLSASESSVIAGMVGKRFFLTASRNARRSAASSLLIVAGRALAFSRASM